MLILETAKYNGDRVSYAGNLNWNENQGKVQYEDVNHYIVFRYKDPIDFGTT